MDEGAHRPESERVYARNIPRPRRTGPAPTDARQLPRRPHEPGGHYQLVGKLPGEI